MFIFASETANYLMDFRIQEGKDMQRQQLLTLVLAVLLATYASAQPQVKNQRLSNEIKSNMLKAYDYRTDIDKKVLATTKKWPDKYGILHNDWIENTNGKSITLAGDIILPQYEYTQLERFCDSLYIMKVGSKRGVVSSSGRVVVPFDYWKINIKRITDGLIFGQQNAAGTGRVDMWSILGNKVCQLDNVQFMDASYLHYKNMVVVSCQNNGQQEPSETYFFPDGTAYEDDSTALVGHPSMELADWLENNEYDNQAFQENVWVKKFWDFYERKKYSDALFCISFFDNEERQSLCSDASIPNYITFTSILDCYKRLGMEEQLVRTVKATTLDHRLPRGLVFNIQDNCVESTLELLYSGLEQEYVTGMVSDINNLYANSLRGYQASVEQRQQNAQMWIAAMSATAQAVTTTLQNIEMAERSSNSSSPGARQSGGKAGRTSATASDNSSDSDSDSEKDDEQKPVDTSRIDRKIKDLEEKLQNARIREAKEHNTMTVMAIQSLEDNIKDLKKYREELLRGK